MTSLSGAWVLVSGASSGIGAEFARQMARDGAHLVLTARREHELERLARKLAAAHHVETHVVTGDLSEPGGAERVCRSVDQIGVPIDHLINNAGFGSVGPFVETDAARQASMVRLNCESLMMLSRHFLPGMVRRQRGGIVHVASVAGHMPVPYMATYGATKAFVLSLSLALAEEVRKSKVRICALCPGPVPSGFQAAAGMPSSNVSGAIALSAEETVTRALAAYEAGEVLCVPGVLNTVQTLSSKFLPRALMVRSAAEAMRRMGRAKS
ncbi:MAG TPA: SDR family oxidoreductase [Polyangiaceae bacterium]|nr:SDR family oxidoreductase [Polyangiaceae bacterium]